MNAVTEVKDEALLPADPMINLIERMVQDEKSDMDKLERMLAMKERIDAQNVKALADQAFSRASAKFPDIPLNGHNKHNNTRYALLKDIIKHTRPVLAEHGLSLSFSTEVTDKEVIVTAELSHEAGHTKTNSLPLPRDAGAGRNAVQAVGSSQTYGQRYTAQAILGLSLGEDTEDDGIGAGQAQRPSVTPRSASWEQTIVQELPDNATPREKAEAISEALCNQFKRMKGVRQLGNEWDRRVHLIDGESGFQGKHPDLWETVIDAYENRKNEIEETA